MSGRWLRFWIIWTACLVPVVWSLYYDNGPQMAGGKPLARIEKLEGNVTIRSEGRMIWQKATVGQDLYNNDLIATEDKSRAIVKFYEGRKLQMSPESVVKLGLPSPLSKDLEISVLKGRMFVNPDNTAKSGTSLAAKANVETQLIVKTADEEKILLEDGKKELSARKSDSKFSLKNSLGMTALAALAKNSVCPPPAPTPEPPVCEAPAEADLEGGKPTVPTFDQALAPVIEPSSGEFWTAEPLERVKNKPINLEVNLPKKRPKEGWTGIANLSGPDGFLRIAGKSDIERRKVSVTLNELLSSNVIKDLMMPAFAVQTGYVLEVDELLSPVEYLAPKTDVFQVHSLASGNGVMVGFDKVQAEKPSSSWLFVTPKAKSRIQVGVTDPADRKKLFGFVSGNSGRASRSDWIGLPSEGAFMVRGDRIIGTVISKDLSSEEWDRLRKAFSADLIYSGSSAAFIGKKTLDIDRLQAQTNKVYVYNRGEFVEIELGLLKTRPNTMKFVEGLSTYMFREPTQILSQAR